MALKSGRVGVAPDQVDVYGRITGSSPSGGGLKKVAADFDYNHYLATSKGTMMTEATEVWFNSDGTDNVCTLIFDLGEDFTEGLVMIEAHVTSNAPFNRLAIISMDSIDFDNAVNGMNITGSSYTYNDNRLNTVVYATHRYISVYVHSGTFHDCIGTAIIL